MPVTIGKSIADPGNCRQTLKILARSFTAVVPASSKAPRRVVDRTLGSGTVPGGGSMTGLSCGGRTLGATALLHRSMAEGRSVAHVRQDRPGAGHPQHQTRQRGPGPTWPAADLATASSQEVSRRNGERLLQVTQHVHGGRQEPQEE